MDVEGKKKKCLLISCSILLILIIILIIVVVLYFVMFKPKSPEINSVPVSLDRLKFTRQSLLPVSLNITLGVDDTVKNKNYAAFKIKRTNTTIYYHETLVGEASVDPRVVSARSTITLNTTVDIDVATMTRSGSFLADTASGLLPFTSETKTTGKVIILNVFKLHATVDVLCNVGVSLFDSTTNTICNTTVHV